jgi:hypothetical protein
VGELHNVLNCSASTSIEGTKKGLFTLQTEAPFTFTDGLLNALFDQSVQLWADEHREAELAAHYAVVSSSGFVTTVVQVSQRFIDELGSPFPASVVQAAVADVLGLSTNNILACNVRSQNDVRAFLLC